MKTTIYTYQNGKKVNFTVPKYYLVEDKDCLEKVIDKLLDIDAVSTPAELTFPCILEMKPGFTPELKKSSLKKVKEDLENFQVFFNKCKKAVKK